jgi:DNA topoisomerase IA
MWSVKYKHLQTLEFYVVVEGEGEWETFVKVQYWQNDKQQDKAGQIFLKFPACDANEPFEGYRQEKFDTEVNYNFYSPSYVKYYF